MYSGYNIDKCDCGWSQVWEWVFNTREEGGETMVGSDH